MKLRGGYNVRLAGKPSEKIDVLPEPEVLHIPLWSRRFKFTQLLVAEGRRVQTGQALAKDPSSFSLPLLAPRSGTVRLGAVAEHVTLEDLAKDPDPPPPPSGLAGMSEGMRRYVLFALGAWRYGRDVYTGALPDPFGSPKAVIVSTERFEPYVASGRAQLKDALPQFVQGLEILNSLLKPRDLCVVIPKDRSAFASQLSEALKALSFVTVAVVAPKYPHGDLRVLARALRLKKSSDDSVWGFPAAGVLAFEDALRTSRPCAASVISIGGPAAEEPRHVETLIGYPLKNIVDRTTSSGYRVINGGALTGNILGPEQAGVDVECEGLTLVPEHSQPEAFSFAHPGWSKRSIARAFFSALRPAFLEKYTTALRGETRACVSCGFCEEVCPAGIMPNLIHKYLYQGALEDAEKARLDLCVECGLCSFVCPSKIELRAQLIEAKETIRNELETEEAIA